MSNSAENNKEVIGKDPVLKSIVDTLMNKLPELKVISDSFSAVYFSFKGVPALRIIVLKDLSSMVRNIEFISEANDSAKELISFIRKGGLRQNDSGNLQLYVDLKLSFLTFTERDPVEAITIDDLYKDIEVPATEGDKKEMRINKANLNLGDS